MRYLIAIPVLVALAVPAQADRPLTEGERARVIEAVQVQGCSGGEMEFDEDDRQFEVDDAVCADGKKYDLKFGADFQFIRKNLD
jgi:hypothetical protein